MNSLQRIVLIVALIPFIVLGLFPADTAYGQLQETLSLQDFNRLRTIRDVRISPDGKSIAFVLETVDPQKDSYSESIWVIPAEGGDPVRITQDPKKSIHPRWSPDGARLAFLSRRDERTQIFLHPVTGGDASQAFQFNADIEDFSWSPDGGRIAFVAVDPDPVKPDESPAAKSDVRVIGRIGYKKDGKGFLDEKRSHLWVYEPASGKARKITDGEFDDEDPQWSPDGKRIAFVSNRTRDPDRNNNRDIWVVGAEGGAVSRMTANAGPDFSPRWSPDGRMIAYLARARPNDDGAHTGLWVVPAGGGPAVHFPAPMDRGIAERSYDMEGESFPAWSPDSRTIYVPIQDRARVHVHAVNLETKQFTPVLAGEKFVEFAELDGAGKFLVFSLSDPLNPADLYVSDTKGQILRRLTSLNDWISSRSLSRPQGFRYRSFDGLEIEGWVLKPAGGIPGGKFPAILAVHGGPQWFFGQTFSFDMQWMAARGYLVMYFNPRGSSGYGQAFADLVRGRPTQDDFRDLMMGVDQVVKDGRADPGNLFVHGYSYGGTMALWCAAHTGRFRAAAAGGGHTDYFSAFGVDDGAADWVSEFGFPWENEERYRRLSPISYVKNIKTPVMLYHGENDLRCPVAQSEQMYAALKYLGVDTQLVLFPDESHGLDGKPSHYRELLERIIGWFDRHRSAAP